MRYNSSITERRVISGGEVYRKESACRDADAVDHRDDHILPDEYDSGRTVQYRAREREDGGNDGGEIRSG